MNFNINIQYNANAAPKLVSLLEIAFGPCHIDDRNILIHPKELK